MSKAPYPHSILEKGRKIFNIISSLALVLQRDSKKNLITLLRPGSSLGEWQRWKIASKKEELAPSRPLSSFASNAENSYLRNEEVETDISGTSTVQNQSEQPPLSTLEIISQTKSQPILLDAATPPPLSISKSDWIVGVPTRDLIVIPLWVDSQGDLQELIMLELSSKHLLRRGMSEGLKMITHETQEERTLVVVFAPTTIPSVATAPYLKQADYFEAAARLLPIENIDLVVWKELGEICFGFVKKNQYLWFSGSGETEINSFLLGLIKRMAFHLQAESVLERIPQTVRMIGSFSKEEHHLLLENLGISENDCDSITELNSPIIPSPLLDLPSEQAREERVLQEKKNRIKKVIAVALLGYFLMLFLGATNLLFKKITVTHLSYQLSAAASAVKKANEEIIQWQEFRFAIDPTTYALDLLAAIASQIHGEKIRLTSLSAIAGRLQITGEASDVSQAYHFLELIKKAPEFQEYEWTSSQPKLAGKNSVKFETEGSLPHAKTSP
ncbi:MAG: hypothetical protein K9M81_06315 [Chthoniobacterales bacterium]|nr:hypothetical protein [Chthoniobacterales bacterium]